MRCERHDNKVEMCEKKQVLPEQIKTERCRLRTQNEWYIYPQYPDDRPDLGNARKSIRSRCAETPRLGEQ
jgi:hypothetical protein